MMGYTGLQEAMQSGEARVYVPFHMAKLLGSPGMQGLLVLSNEIEVNISALKCICVHHRWERRQRPLRRSEQETVAPFLECNNTNDKVRHRFGDR